MLNGTSNYLCDTVKVFEFCLHKVRLYLQVENDIRTRNSPFDKVYNAGIKKYKYIVMQTFWIR